MSKNSIEIEDGKITYILLLRDLTELKQLELQVQRRERLTALGELASGVAHEIRNPLNAIGTVIQQLDRDFEPVENREDYHQLSRLVYQEVKRINRTIENFLTFARPEPLSIEEFELKDFLEEIRQQYDPMVRKRGMELEIITEWQGKVAWDRGKMKQVLSNLLQNSIEAMTESGMVTITVNKLSAQSLEFRVVDDGPGIPAEIHRKIFNLYFTTKPSGTGIGLSIVQQLVDLHRGVIILESQESKGTAFIIRLPVSVAQ